MIKKFKYQVNVGKKKNQDHVLQSGGKPLKSST
jgi:hypothetical protein